MRKSVGADHKQLFPPADLSKQIMSEQSFDAESPIKSDGNVDEEDSFGCHDHMQ